MAITKFTRSKDERGRLYWLADDWSGLVILREKGASSEWNYIVKHWAFSCKTTLGIFQSKAEALDFIEAQD